MLGRVQRYEKRARVTVGLCLDVRGALTSQVRWISTFRGCESRFLEDITTWETRAPKVD